MCTCSRTLLSRLSRILERGARHNDRDISRVTKSFEIFFHEKMVHVNINCGRCCGWKGCPRTFCAIIGDCIGIAGTERGVWIRACFNLPPRWPYPAAHHPTARCDLHKIGVPSASTRSNRAYIDTRIWCFDSDVRTSIAGTTWLMHVFFAHQYDMGHTVNLSLSTSYKDQISLRSSSCTFARLKMAAGVGVILRIKELR